MYGDEVKNRVLSILEEAGIYVLTPYSSDVSKLNGYQLKLNDEIVGWGDNGVLYLYRYMPSLEEIGAVKKEGKSSVPLDHPLSEIETRLRNAVHKIKRSAENYDGILKKHRAKQVKLYFDARRAV